MHLIWSLWLGSAPVCLAQTHEPHSAAPASPLTNQPDNVVHNLISLQGGLPQLKGLGSEHFSDGVLHFVKGHRTVPNPHYAEQLQAYQAAQARRDATESTHRIKQSAAALPQQELTEWDANGVAISMRFTPGPRGSIQPVRAAMSLPIVGYEAIDLTDTAGEFSAWIPGYRVDLSVDGPTAQAVQTAIFDTLLQHAVPPQP